MARDWNAREVLMSEVPPHLQKGVVPGVGGTHILEVFVLVAEMDL
jgi:hypothetical protein